MDKKKRITLAIDIGASGGRHIISYYENQNRKFDEVYRFENYMDQTSEGLTWNIERLWKEIKKGIMIASNQFHNIDSIGIDTWGVDYVLLNHDKIIEPVYAYRNKRTEVSIPLVHHLIPFERLYEITGCQFQPYNTIYQLYHDKESKRLNQVTDFLMLPEYFFYKLTGKKVKEYTNATTTGLVDIKRGEYSVEVIERLGFNPYLFQPLTKPKFVSPLRTELRHELKTDAKVVLISTHDTASAVEGINIGNYELYLSSGTWSLLGVKITEPILTPEALNFNFSHEGGIHYLRFQKNITGLWILQNLKKEFGYEKYEKMISDAKASVYTELFDVEDKMFLAPESMNGAIFSYMSKYKKPLPKFKGDYIKSFFISLATCYDQTIKEIEEITNRTYETLTIFGGGAKNHYLNQIIEEITKKKVIAYPIEATAIGNINIQEESL